MDSTENSILDDLVGAELDTEISSLRAQISALKSHHTLQISTILTSHSTKATLTRLRTSKSKQPATSLPPDTDPLHTTSTQQLLHKQENLYRACGSITTFRIRDPDPHAVDNGNVFGIRFDVSSNGRFVRPYYVMLNKPIAGTGLLRVHRHTIPPCIPLSFLADKYLPHSKGSTSMGTKASPGSKKQDLRKFVRALRKEVVGYHNRVTVIKSLRKEFKLDEKENKKGKGREKVIADISAADAEAKQVKVEWVDGRIGRCVVDEGGRVVRCVVFGDGGRDGEVERAVVGSGMEGIGEALREGIY